MLCECYVNNISIQQTQEKKRILNNYLKKLIIRFDK